MKLEIYGPLGRLMVGMWYSYGALSRDCYVEGVSFLDLAFYVVR